MTNLNIITILTSNPTNVESINPTEKYDKNKRIKYTPPKQRYQKNHFRPKKKNFDILQPKPGF